MTEINRRALLTGLAALVAAPTIVRAQSIMPVRKVLPTVTITPGVGFIRQWPSGTPYSLGSIVDVMGQLYVCIEEHSTADLAKFALL